MSNWTKPRNISKRRRRGKLSYSTPCNEFPSEPRPPGLKGKEIGLYYKNLAKNKEKPERVLNFAIPRCVITKLQSNLKRIAAIAERDNISLTQVWRTAYYKKGHVNKDINNKSSDEEIVATSFSKVDSLILSHAKSVISPANKKDGKSTIENLIIKSEFPTNCNNVVKSKPSEEDLKPKIKLENADIQSSSVTDDDDSDSVEEVIPNTLPTDFVPLKSLVTEKPIIIEDLDKPPIKQFRKKNTEDLEPKPGDLIIRSNFYVNNTPEPSNSKPSTSKAPDFIKMKIDKTEEYCESKDKLLSLRGGGDYKYSYEDIITGTFSEKLEESLSRGITINKETDEINDLSVALYEDYQYMVTKPQFLRMMKFRETLPTYKKSNELLNMLRKNQIIVISGETGCGKSTQVPQIILDDAILNNRGANIKILVTQPRRIAASSLAMRVAQERAEEMGNSVGYAVRLEKVDARPRGSIMFVTTGVLLVDLEMNQGLTEYSHIILDEVHERDCHIDLAMCMLKQVLHKRRDLKLILMSATIDADALSAYFNNCPTMHIEGLAYPVEQVYLEDILGMTKFTLDPFPGSGSGGKHYKGQNQRGKDFKKDIQYKAEIAPWLESIKHKLHLQVYRTLQDSRIEVLNTHLILELLIHICKGPPGAILVFLPGIGDISQLIRIMEESKNFPSSSYQIHPVHSKLPSLTQHQIFEKPPNGVRKIIIATNIAETSITIDDIVYVVDSGRMKLSGLDVENNYATLKTEWIAKANLRQRRGRAGRCQPGICYHLLTSFRAKLIPDRILPELQRSNLLEPVLAMKKLRLGKVADALKLVLDPPAETTVNRAIKHLQHLGALNDLEVLTPLGWHLARLPVHPAAGKLLLLGALFGCLDRAACVAAMWGFKDPFQLVIGKETDTKIKKRELALGEPSDHIAMSEALLNWERLPPQKRFKYAYDNFLANNTLQLLSEMKMQLGDSLKQMGFLSSGDVRSSWENRNSDNLSLFKAIIAASLYPNVASVRWKNVQHRNKRKFKPVSILARTGEGRVNVHPSSVMCPSRDPRGEVPFVNTGSNWLVYWLKQRSSDLYIIDVTCVYTLPLLFFGESSLSPAEEPDECIFSISTLKVKCKDETADLLIELRALLDQVLASKITSTYTEHATRHSEFEESVLNAVIELITAEDEQVDYLEDDTESDRSEYEFKR